MRYKYVAIFAVCLVAVSVVAWYQSQLQSSYSDGGVTTEQVLWLNFDNRTAVYHYSGCTPSMPGYTLDGCAFTVLTDTASEYRVKVYCEPGA